MGSWSIILNVLLLVGVLIAVVRSMLSRRASIQPLSGQPSVGRGASRQSEPDHYDDIISVRKVSPSVSEPSVPMISSVPEPEVIQPWVQVDTVDTVDSIDDIDPGESPTIMLFLLAKDDRKLAGYELLQTLLAAGLRFGEGHLFHRHQHQNGQGPVLCSVAAATPSGLFDMQNIGAFSVRGLCIFMKPSENTTIDAERFAIMLDTALQLSEDLDAYLLDDNRQPLTEATIDRYRRLLSIELYNDLARA